MSSHQAGRHPQRAPGIVYLLTIEQFLEGFVPITALHGIMFSRVGGLDSSQIGTLFAVWAAAYVVAELPSGVLADYWSRRKVLLIGALCRTLGFAAWILAPGFGGYAVGFALWGVMLACGSGAVAAYLHCELEARGQENSFGRYFGWLMAGNASGKLVGFALAAALTLANVTVLLALCVGGSVLLAILMFCAHESPYPKQATYIKTLLAGVHDVRHNKRLRYMCFTLFSVCMTTGIVEEYVPRLYATFGLGERSVALFVGGAMLIVMLVLTRLHLFLRLPLSVQLLGMAGGTLTAVGAASFGGSVAIGLVLLTDIILQLMRPVFEHHVQAAARSSQRATIASIPGLSAGLIGIVGYWFIGFMGVRSGEPQAIAWYSSLWLVVFIGLAVAGRHYRSMPLGADEVVPGPERSLA